MATNLKAQSKDQSTLFPPAWRSGDSRAEYARPLLRRNSRCFRSADDSSVAVSALESLRMPDSVFPSLGVAAGLDTLPLDTCAGPLVGLGQESISPIWPLCMAAAVDDEDDEEEDDDLDAEDDDLEDEDGLDDEEEDDDLEDDEEEEDEDYEDLDEDDEEDEDNE